MNNNYFEEENASEFNGTTFPLEKTKKYDMNYFVIFVLYILCPLLGLFPNILVIILSLKKNVVQETYKYFILNLAIADLTVCLALLVHLIHVVVLVRELCVMNGILLGMVMFCMIFDLPLLSFCRFVKLYHTKRYKTFFSRKGCLLICTLVLLISVSLTLMFIMGGTVGNVRIHGRIPLCFIIEWRKKSWLIYLAKILGLLLILLSLLLLGYFNYKLHKKIKMMHSTALTLRQKRRVEDSKALLKVSVIQGLPPVLSIMPVFLIILFNSLGIKNERMLTTVSVMIVMLNPFIDAITTLFIIKPYKEAVKALVNGIKAGVLTIGNGISVVSTVNINRN